MTDDRWINLTTDPTEEEEGVKASREITARPESVYRFFPNHDGTRSIVVFMDGTVSWVMETVEQIKDLIGIKVIFRADKVDVRFGSKEVEPTP